VTFTSSDTQTTPNWAKISYLYTARRYDPESHLMFYRSRYMDSQLGRFISSDTIGVWGDPNSLGNGYAYAGNFPGSSVDPVGTYACQGSNAASSGRCMVCPTPAAAMMGDPNGSDYIDDAGICHGTPQCPGQLPYTICYSNWLDSPGDPFSLMMQDYAARDLQQAYDAGCYGPPADGASLCARNEDTPSATAQGEGGAHVWAGSGVRKCLTDLTPSPAPSDTDSLCSAAGDYLYPTLATCSMSWTICTESTMASVAAAGSAAAAAVDFLPIPDLVCWFCPLLVKFQQERQGEQTWA
jgi:RHS repeat-associated protein